VSRETHDVGAYADASVVCGFEYRCSLVQSECFGGSAHPALWDFAKVNDVPLNLVAAHGVLHGPVEDGMHDHEGVRAEHVFLLASQLSDSYYPAKLAEGTELAGPKKLRGYSFAALERLGIKIDHFRDDLYARVPTPAEARLLHLGEGTPVVRQLRVTLAEGNEPVEVADQILASDRYVLSYEIAGTVSGTMSHQAEEPARG